MNVTWQRDEVMRGMRGFLPHPTIAGANYITPAIAHDLFASFRPMWEHTLSHASRFPHLHRIEPHGKDFVVFG